MIILGVMVGRRVLEFEHRSNTILFRYGVIISCIE